MNINHKRNVFAAAASVLVGAATGLIVHAYDLRHAKRSLAVCEPREAQFPAPPPPPVVEAGPTKALSDEQKEKAAQARLKILASEPAHAPVMKKKPHHAKPLKRKF